MAKEKSGDGVREVRPGVFVATMYDPRVKGGTKHIGTFTADQYGGRLEAKKAARDAKRSAEELRDLQTKSPGADETCASFARRWPRDYTRRRGQTTLEHNAERVKAFIRDFGERAMTEIKRAEADAWIRGGIVPPQVRKTARQWHGAQTLPDGDVVVPNHRANLIAVRAMFNDFARTFRDEMPSYNSPFAELGIEQSKGRSGDAITVLTESELALLVEVAIETYGEYGHHFGALIETAAWTGLRPGELWALEIDKSFDWARGEIHVQTQVDKMNRRRAPKWNSQRIVYMLPPAASAIRRAIGDRTLGPVWLTKRDAVRLTGRTLGYYWAPVRAAFWKSLPPERRSRKLSADGGPELGKIAADFDFYELRHLYGTHLAEQGEPPSVIAKQMGHKDGGELAHRRYIHPREESVKRDLLERFEEHRRRQQLREAAG